MTIQRRLFCVRFTIVFVINRKLHSAARVFHTQRLWLDRRSQSSFVDFCIQDIRNINGLYPLQDGLFDDQLALNHLLLIGIIRRIVIQTDPFRLPLLMLEYPHAPGGHRALCC